MVHDVIPGQPTRQLAPVQPLVHPHISPFRDGLHITLLAHVRQLQSMFQSGWVAVVSGMHAGRHQAVAALTLTLRLVVMAQPLNSMMMLAQMARKRMISSTRRTLPPVVLYSCTFKVSIV